MDTSAQGGISPPNRGPGRGRGRGGARANRPGSRGVEHVPSDSVRKPSARGRGRGKKPSSDTDGGSRQRSSQDAFEDSGVTDEVRFFILKIVK
jgi:hypothetical protein